MRGRAAMAIYFANTHPTNAGEIINAMRYQVKHEDPRELTRKECVAILKVAAQFGYVDPVGAS